MTVKKMPSDKKEPESDTPLDQTDGIIPPVIVKQSNGYTTLENESVRFKNRKIENEEPEIIMSADALPSAPPPYAGDNNLSTSNTTSSPTSPTDVPKTIPQRILAFVTMVVQNITLEPGEFLYGLGGGIAYTCYSQLTLDKACYDRGYNETICSNVTSYDDIYDLINHDIAQFNVWLTAVQSVFPCLISFYAGAWSDIFGRKVIIYAFGIATCLDYGGYFLNAIFFDWPLWVFLPTTIFRSLIGGYGIWLAATYAFLADISAPEILAFRMGMLHLCKGLTGPIGPPIGAALYNAGGYTLVFGIAFGMTVIGTVLLFWRIRSYEWKSNVSEKQSKRQMFHWRHAWEAIQVTFRKRKGPNRMFALLTITIFFFQVMPYFGEGAISYLYVQKRYDWGISEYSKYSTVTSTASLIGQSILIPLLNLLKVREPVILFLVMLSVFIRHIVKGLASESWMYYLGAMIDILGGYASSITRAMLSFCVPKEELGKIYSVLSFIDGILPFAVSEVYAQIWILTDNTVPGAVFFLSASITSIGLILCIVVTCMLKGRKMTDLKEYIESPEELESKAVYPNIPPPSYQEAMGYGRVSSF